MKQFSRVWLCDPVDCSLPGSSIHGIFQARVLEWGAIAFSIHLLKEDKKCLHWKLLWKIRVLITAMMDDNNKKNNNGKHFLS